MRHASIDDVLLQLRAGGLVILVDDESRENEGDLVGCTDLISAESVAFMAREARGLICVTLEQQVAQRLQIPLQVVTNNSPFQTAFTVTVDHRQVLPQGVTSASRAFTMRKLVDPMSSPQDFVTPGHVVPLLANPAGVFGRRGQTEGSVDLARLAGRASSGVICEILNPDGSICRGADLERFAEHHRLPITSIEALVAYRLAHEVRVRETSRRLTATDWGEFEVVSFVDDATQREHLALLLGGYSQSTAQERGVLARVHSECLTGDVFGSKRCDCGAQLAAACARVRSEGTGAVVYLRQEGRGIGLGNKIRAYELQDRGHDTVEANTLLGFPADDRNFAVAAAIFRALGITSIRLLTNNPRKIEELSQRGIVVRERVPLQVPVEPAAEHYLITKRERLGHLL